MVVSPASMAARLGADSPSSSCVFLRLADRVGGGEMGASREVGGEVRGSPWFSLYSCAGEGVEVDFWESSEAIKEV